MSDMITLQERILHLEKMVEDLSDVVARQDQEMAVLTRRVHMLMERAAEQEMDATGGTIPLADQRPPHW